MQDPTNTQNYNRYGYVLNNPLRYTDESGEFFFTAILGPIGFFIDAACWGAVIGGAGYTASVALSNGGFNNWNWGQFAKSVGIGAVSGVVTAGIGSVFRDVGKFGHEVLRGLAHGFANGGISELTGGSFLQGFASGALGSLAGSGFQAWGGNFAKSAVGTIGFSSVAGGVGAELTGGEFWKGAVIGATVAGLNHLAHNGGGDDDKRKNGKGNSLRGGSQKQRDGDLSKYPKEFKEWYHDPKNIKDYKLPGQPDPNLSEPYNDWLQLGKPRSFTAPASNWNWDGMRNYVSTATGLTGAALTAYIIVSVGSRFIFPVRNLVPLP